MQQQQQAFPIYSGNFQSHHPRPQQQPLPPPQQFTNNPYRPSPVLPQTNYSTQQQQQQQPSRKIYACKEQGCTEYFDQPTALRHHQKAAHGGNEEIQAKIAGQNKPYVRNIYHSISLSSHYLHTSFFTSCVPFLSAESHLHNMAT
jgi:hypothetical protein